jgi:hypothetical protein
MLPHFHIGLSAWQRIILILLASLGLLAPALSQAVELDWGRTGKEALKGELTAFDFESKTLTIKESASGDEKSFPSSELDSRSRWFLLFSQQFFGSILQQDHRSEHLHLAIVFIAIPAALYLVTFWLAALLVTGRLNPLRAIIALPGAWILSGLLIVFYEFMIGRYPQNMTFICILGGLVTLTVASLFVSIIYHKTVFHGLTIIILHSILAPLLFFSAIYASYRFGDTEKVDSFFANSLFIPAGLLEGEEDH